jgi:hypothetical protein
VREFRFLYNLSLIKQNPRGAARGLASVPLAVLLAVAPGCPLSAAPALTAATGAGTSVIATASPVPTVISSGPRAIRIIFKQTYPSGSFDASPSNGSPAVPGSGQQATRYFNADGSILAGGGPGASTWLSGFEIGISGANNNSAKNPACAKFADSTESTATANCLFGSSPIGCGAPNGLFRISEWDCVGAPGEPTLDGNGGPADGVYLRASINRALLGTGENLMVSLEYVAAAYNAAPANPLDCFSNGVPLPEKCSNVTWKTFLKHSATELVQPFLMLVPPTQSFVNTTLGTSGVSPQTRQFVLPISGDPGLNTVQISRIHSNLDSNASKATCNAGSGSPANSPLCAGLILYALTLYRI